MYTFLLFIIIISLLMIAGLFFDAKESDGNITSYLSMGYTNALRGLAMIMIMYGHIADRYHESVWFSPLACTGVAMFLLLSGFGNNESFISKKKFPAKKLLRIAIPYWILVIFMLLYNINMFNIKNLLLDITFIKTKYWFVGYIFKWYVIYWFCIKYFFRYRWYIFFSFSIFSYFMLAPLESEQSLSFLFGVFISENKHIFNEKNNIKLNLLAVFLFFFATIFLGLKQIAFFRYNDQLLTFLQLLIKLPYAISIIILMRYIKFLKSNPILLFIAPITYELYLTHMPLLSLINTDSKIQVIISTTFVVIVSIILASIFNSISNKIFKNFVKMY